MSRQPVELARSETREGWALRFALYCGAVPLIVILSIFSLWFLTGAPFLESLGLLTVLVTPFVVGAGILGLWTHVAAVLRMRAQPRGALWIRATAALALLLINFPAALGALSAAIWVTERYTVVVHNESSEALEDVRIQAGGAEIPFPVVPPGACIRRSFGHGSSPLVFMARSGETQYVRMVDDSPMPEHGNRRIVRVHADGTLTAHDRAGRTVSDPLRGGTWR